ncbi:MAG: glycosyltransferase family 4 protein [Proteobacteria bacterium]|nr:glycosyltransferase family 4 protein [Pseudomonadota bacterium]
MLDNQMNYLRIVANKLANIIFAYSPQCKAILHHSLFDAAYYHEQYRGNVGSELKLLRHYLVKGFCQGHDPHRLFSTSYYLQNNPEIVKSGMNPLIHYLKNCYRERRDPHPLFDTSYYLENNPDVTEAGINPLVHFVQCGCKERRDPHPLFDTSYYLSETHGSTDVEGNPLLHYLQVGYKEKKSPHPLFSTSYYLENNPDVAKSGMNPLIHYVQYGCKERRDPHPLFDTSYYLSETHGSTDVEGNPLLHYLQVGYKDKKSPHPLFSTSYYLENNPDVAKSGMNPLIHYVQYGCNERRDPHRLFHSLFYCRKYGDSVGNQRNPLLHFFLFGLAKRTDPHPLFNTTYYLQKNPEAIESGVNPLVHFLEKGYKKENDLYLYRKYQKRKIKNILILQLGLPKFDHDSGSLRSYNLILMLVESGYNVILWAPEELGYERYAREFKDLNIDLPYKENGIKDYLQEKGTLLDMVILCRMDAARQYLDIIMALTDVKIVFDTVDLHHLREEREARILNRDVDNTIKSQELHYARCADEVLVVSPIEKEIFELEGLKEKVSIVTNVHTLQPLYRSFTERAGLMFIGGFEHQPNVDGIIWFVQKIFPIIQNQIPGIHLDIVGSHPPAPVLSLGSADIAVTGYVVDVIPYFNKARVFISPLRYGAGVKGKIGQSMAFKLPVVTTAIGAEGMYLEDSYNAMIADDEELFAQKVIKLYQDQTLWELISHRAGMVIQQYFSPEVVKKALLKVIERDD